MYVVATPGTMGLPPAKSSRNSYGCSARTVLTGYPLHLYVAWPGNFGKKRRYGIYRWLWNEQRNHNSNS